MGRLPALLGLAAAAALVGPACAQTKSFEVEILPADSSAADGAEYDLELDEVADLMSALGYDVHSTEMFTDPAALDAVGVDVSSGSRMVAAAAGYIEVSGGGLL